MCWEQITAALEELKRETREQFGDRHDDGGQNAALYLGWRQARLIVRYLDLTLIVPSPKTLTTPIS